MTSVGVFYRWIAPSLIFVFSLSLLGISLSRISAKGANSTLSSVVTVSIIGMIAAVVMFAIAQFVHRRALRDLMTDSDEEERRSPRL